MKHRDKTRTTWMQGQRCPHFIYFWQSQCWLNMCFFNCISHVVKDYYKYDFIKIVKRFSNITTFHIIDVNDMMDFLKMEKAVGKHPFYSRHFNSKLRVNSYKTGLLMHTLTKWMSEYFRWEYISSLYIQTASTM